MDPSDGVSANWNEGGVLVGVRQIPSPNHDSRPFGEPVTVLVVHGISLPSGSFGGASIEQLFTNTLDVSVHPHFEELRNLRVSTHFLVRRDGELIQFVRCDERAWHAGVSSWHARDRCNDYSIGVELEGTDDSFYTDAQYRCLGWLTCQIRRRYPLTDVIGHSDASPGRKTDPGRSFDWGRVRALCPQVS